MTAVVDDEPYTFAPEPVAARVRLDGRFVGAATVAAILAVAVFLRLWRLDSLPGVNGDEAWLGVQALNLLRGEPVHWRTPTGNPLNPFAFLPLVASHAFFAPSIAQLRWVAAASGILALAVNWLLCRRVFGPQTALVTTMALAVLPMNIAYSRFGWDASQTLLFTLPVLYLPLLALQDERHPGRWLVAALAAFGASVLVHPTNVFTAPLVLIPAAVAYRDTLRRWSHAVRATPYRRLSALLAGIAIASLTVWAGWSWWRPAIGRVFSLAEAGRFVHHVLDLFSGVTAYRFVSGTLLAPRELALGMTDLGIIQAVVTATFLAAGIGLYARLNKTSDAVDRCLVVGTLATFVGFYLIAGPDAIRPHWERYAQCLVAAGVLLAARGFDWYLGQLQTRRVAIGALVALAWLNLAGFYAFYIRPLATGSGSPHVAFRTAALDPKEAALRLAISDHGPGPLTIGADSWWIYWPLRYLAAAHPQVTIHTDAAFGPRNASGPRPPVDCWIEWVDSDAFDARVAAAAARGAYREAAIVDAAGRPLLSVIFLPRPHARRDRAARADSPSPPVNARCQNATGPINAHHAAQFRRYSFNFFSSSRAPFDLTTGVADLGFQ